MLGLKLTALEDPPGELHGDVNDSDEPIEVMVIEMKSPSS